MWGLKCAVKFSQEPKYNKKCPFGGWNPKKGLSKSQNICKSLLLRTKIFVITVFGTKNVCYWPLKKPKRVKLSPWESKYAKVTSWESMQKRHPRNKNIWEVSSSEPKSAKCPFVGKNKCHLWNKNEFYFLLGAKTCAEVSDGSQIIKKLPLWTKKKKREVAFTGEKWCWKVSLRNQSFLFGAKTCSNVLS